MKAALALAMLACAHAGKPLLYSAPSGQGLPANVVPAHVKARVSKQDFTLRCPAGQAAAVCKKSFPKVWAKDHNGLDLAVTSRVWEMRQLNQKWATHQIKDTQINFAKPGTYLLTYDAVDAAGNPAEQLVFALMIDDRVKPVIEPCPSLIRSTPIEAGENWSWCQSKATDAVDGDVSPYIKYDIKSVALGRTFRGLSLNDAQRQVNRWTLGSWQVTLRVSDKAGNVATRTLKLVVQDTTAPDLTIHGRNPITDQQCAATYTDGGVSASDTYDDHEKISIKVSTRIAGPKGNAAPTFATLSKRTGDYVITYSAKDSNGQSATPVTRPVTVVDTHKPSLSLNGFPALETHYIGGKFSRPTVTCKDTCDSSPKLTEKWVPGFGIPKTYSADPTSKNFFSLDLKQFEKKQHSKKFVKEYTCTDYTGLSVSKRVTYLVEDNTKPVLNIVPPQNQFLAASKNAAAWADPGAECKDFSDGDIKPVVTFGATGKPNMKVPDTYTVTYTCKDSAGNKAAPITRTVKVSDNNCPVITLKGPAVQVVEASFPWIEPGWTVTDDVTANSKLVVTKDGDTVDTKTAFHQFRSCAEIKQAYTKASSGEYAVSVKLPSGKLDSRTVVCDMQSAITYFVVNGDRIKPYHNDQGKCTANGFVMAKRSRITKWAKSYFKNVYFPKPRETSDDYLCTLDGVKLTHDAHHVDKSTIKYAKKGVYKITYHTKDEAGNKECRPRGPVTRVVVVKDTLAPVIVVTRPGTDKYAASSMGSRQETALSQLPLSDPDRQGIPNAAQLKDSLKRRLRGSQ